MLVKSASLQAVALQIFETCFTPGKGMGAKLDKRGPGPGLPRRQAAKDLPNLAPTMRCVEFGSDPELCFVYRQNTVSILFLATTITISKFRSDCHVLIPNSKES